jgi:hypothetical protein
LDVGELLEELGDGQRAVRPVGASDADFEEPAVTSGPVETTEAGSGAAFSRADLSAPVALATLRAAPNV